MKKIIYLSLLLIFKLAFAGSGSATEELASLLNNLHTIEASFEQAIISSKGIESQEKTCGKMLIIKPGKFRWETTSPNHQIIIINQSSSILYDGDLEQLIKRKVDLANPNNPAMLLSSQTEKIKNAFQITKERSSAPLTIFVLTPKNQDGGYHWIKLAFKEKKLTALYIRNNLDQDAVIRFTQLNFNRKIDPKNFIFTPPKNTEVFDER